MTTDALQASHSRADGFLRAHTRFCFIEDKRLVKGIDRDNTDYDDYDDSFVAAIVSQLALWSLLFNN
jgi:predicted oxidoreductase (fatty acid repression mutant protein)